MNNLVVMEKGNLEVSGRELHMFLGVNTPYHKWFPRMTEYGFTEGQDYTVTDKNVHNSSGGKQVVIDHQMTLDMAKEICMLQRTPKGKMAREYFIQIEKKWNSPEQILARAYQITKQMLDESNVKLAESVKKIEELHPKAKVYDHFIEKDHTVGMRDLCNELGINRNMLAWILKHYKIAYYQSRRWKPYANYRDSKYVVVKDGMTAQGYPYSQLRFTMEGKELIKTLFDAEKAAGTKIGTKEYPMGLVYDFEPESLLQNANHVALIEESENWR